MGKQLWCPQTSIWKSSHYDMMDAEGGAWCIALVRKNAGPTDHLSAPHAAS
jgi:hypothetical protein